MFCKYCGSEIENDSTFCKECGKKLDNVEGIHQSEIISIENANLISAPNEEIEPILHEGLANSDKLNDELVKIPKNYSNKIIKGIRLILGWTLIILGIAEILKQFTDDTYYGFASISIILGVILILFGILILKKGLQYSFNFIGWFFVIIGSLN
ncbi:MAG: zinc ribbon domain-containing protein, partial [bacterium]|nr:zinc ribbon domain-containing protein [bacterium]